MVDFFGGDHTYIYISKIHPSSTYHFLSQYLPLASFPAQVQILQPAGWIEETICDSRRFDWGFNSFNESPQK